MRQQLFISIIFIFFFLSCSTSNVFSENETNLKVLQLNVWMAGAKIENGTDAIADIIINTDADLITLSEVNPHFMKSLTSSLQKKGSVFHCIPSNDCGIITKYPILEQEFIYSPEKGFNGVLKTSLALPKRKVCLYSAHLDYQHYGAFLPRGYDGQSWKKMLTPVTNVADVLSFNNESKREEQISELIKDAANESQKGSIILVGGDFNEPSHLDWGETTRNLFDHNGTVILWPCTLMLQNAGFVDTYRELYPNPVTHPGITWPADNPLIDVKALSWAKESDERDRIDFIFYLKKQKLKLESVSIVGPTGTILKGERNSDLTKDSVYTPQIPWPSDHKGLLAIFSLKN